MGKYNLSNAPFMDDLPMFILNMQGGAPSRAIEFSCRTEKWLNSIGFMVDISRTS